MWTIPFYSLRGRPMGLGQTSGLSVSPDAKELLVLMCSADGVLVVAEDSREFRVGRSWLPKEDHGRWLDAAEELAERGLLESIEKSICYRVTLAGAKAGLRYRFDVPESVRLKWPRWRSRKDLMERATG